ncbi:MAG TPA: threonine ammonia-lyase [Candidatus Thermoplasmatota archaeon]|nr:threonine ammonia-lyase [Candidatus Thermoplasmatota archaeon]
MTLADCQDAWQVIRSQVRHTPTKRSTSLAQVTGAEEMHLKLENFQRTGSFKVRGALYKLHRMGADERAGGVVAASAGNHAQGVAYAAAKAGVRSTIFMPEEATLAKVVATRSYGAEVRLVGRDYQEAYEHAREHQRKSGATFVHAFDDPHVMAGQGTLGIELMQDLPQLDTVLVPIGGGGLISGIATAVKALKPDIRVVGVQAEGASTIAPSLQKGEPVRLEHVETMADGIAVRRVGEHTYPVIRELVDEVVTVTEGEIAAAILFLIERAKAVAEGAGAVSLAAAMHRKVDLEGRKACAVVSGGNIDMTLVSRILRMGLVKAGRIAVITTVLPDRPGSLAAFLALLAKHKASVMDLHHDRDRTDLTLNRAVVEVHAETRGPEHIDEICRALRQAGYDARLASA